MTERGFGWTVSGFGPGKPIEEKGVLMADRYALYGVIPTERDANVRAMTLNEQNVGDSGDTLVYETDDREEARAIYEAGGFERGGVWHVVTRVEDRVKRGSRAREGAASSHVPRKTDYRG